MSARPRILVVDDEMGPRESLRMILKPGHEVLTAATAREALEAVRVFRPDLVFTDIKMPEMDGIALLRAIKAIDPAIEVVMITAYASLDTVKHALTHGAFEYLVKPFGRDHLADAARRALARRQTALGTRSQLASLVEEMRALSARTREREAVAQREDAEQSLRVTQLSILREVSRGILGQLDLSRLLAGVAAQLRDALGYDEVRVELGPVAPALPALPAASAVCPIRDEGQPVGHLLVATRTGHPLDPRERELLEMLADHLAVAIRNSRLYGEVAETKRWLEQVISSAGEAIIAIDRADRVASWNPAAERIFRLTAAEAVGLPLVRLIPEAAYRQARGALAPGRPVHGFHVRAPRPDGDLELSVTLSALARGGGEVDGVLAIVRDVTAQRALEAQMLQSEKVAALGLMAGGIAHDFNNLLQSILGYAQLMARNPDNAAIVRRGIEVIGAAAAGGAETVRRIQQFSRRRPDEPLVALDLARVIGDAVAITQPRWDERVAKGGVPLALALDLRPGLPPVIGRPAELTEVMTNLILNAIDAMPGGGTLTIRTAAGPGDEVVIAVSDTGVGMPEPVRRRAFDPFFTTKGERGTGLGLSVSYAIVARHGGELRVESEPGRGATFTIALPVAPTRGAPGEPPDETPPPASGPARILLVDNEPAVLAVLAEILREAGHEVVPAGHGRDALDAFASGRFDVVMTNIGMSGMTGWEVAERVRAQDPGVPIVFLTGWSLHDRDRERCRGMAVNTVLFKPLRPAEIHRALAGVLAGGPGGTAPA